MIGQIFAIARNTLREAVRNRVFATLVFFALGMLGITLATNLAMAFVVGIALAYALKSKRLSV